MTNQLPLDKLDSINLDIPWINVHCYPGNAERPPKNITIDYNMNSQNAIRDMDYGDAFFCGGWGKYEQVYIVGGTNMSMSRGGANMARSNSLNVIFLKSG